MNSSRSAALLLIVGMSLLGKPASSRAQDLTEPTKKEQEAHLRMQTLLDERFIDTKDYPKELPLGKYLNAFLKQLPKEKKFTVRIDKAAFGDKHAEIAALPVRLHGSLRSVMEESFAKSKIKVDYRLGDNEVVITTPEQARYTAVHDMRGILNNPEIAVIIGAAVRKADWFEMIAHADAVSRTEFRKADLADRAARTARAIVEMTARDSDKAVGEPDAFQVLNGTRLLVRAGGSRHAEIKQAIQMFRRLSDLAVTSQARLYEVDDAYYAKLKNAKSFPWEEERIFLEGKADNSLYEGLAKQKRIQTGDEVLVNDHQTVAVLSRQEIRQCLPSPDQVRKGDKGRQSFVIGISFSGDIRISPDRRFIRMKLTERALELQAIKKVKVPTLPQGVSIEEFAVQVKENPWKDVVAEVPVLIESTQTRNIEIPDGGTIIVPVQYRPRSLQEKNKWLVLSITSRIIMEEEEQRILFNEMEQAIPKLVEDVLTNSRLKTTRDYCGTPGDKRFALVDSESWTWPKEFRPKVAGFELTPAKAAGKRLLGIRIDNYRMANNLAIRVTLVNAGGNENGAAIGGCSLSYNARSGDKRWSVQLEEK